MKLVWTEFILLQSTKLIVFFFTGTITNTAHFTEFWLAQICSVAKWNFIYSFPNYSVNYPYHSAQSWPVPRIEVWLYQQAFSFFHLQKVIEVCKKYLPKMACGFRSSKLTQFIGDGFEHMKEYENEFDVIITDSPDPVGKFSASRKRTHTQAVILLFILIFGERERRREREIFFGKILWRRFHFFPLK